MIFNGINEIAGGFTSKVNYRKSSQTMFKLNMLQKAPKWRSPNLYNYQFKWAKIVNVVVLFYEMQLDATVKNNNIFYVANFVMCRIS